jgi:glucose-6-phosphate 1-dehydrogenase
MLDIPVIGVAKAGWTLDQLRARARDSVERYGGLERDAFSRLSRLMDYVDGDYGEAVTFQELRRKLGNAKHPTHYLAIPPAFFGTVPVHEYERGTWGLPQASALIEPDGGWFDPPPPRR